MVLKIEAGRDAKLPRCLWDTAAILHSLDLVQARPFPSFSSLPFLLIPIFTLFPFFVHLFQRGALLGFVGALTSPFRIPRNKCVLTIGMESGLAFSLIALTDLQYHFGLEPRFASFCFFGFIGLSTMTPPVLGEGDPNIRFVTEGESTAAV